MFGAKTDTGDDVPVTVTLDGDRVSYVPGTAMELDPGPHVVRLSDGTHAPIDGRSCFAKARSGA